jgi:hypothetical protein
MRRQTSVVITPMAAATVIGPSRTPGAHLAAAPVFTAIFPSFVAIFAPIFAALVPGVAPFFAPFVSLSPPLLAPLATLVAPGLVAVVGLVILADFGGSALFSLVSRRVSLGPSLLNEGRSADGERKAERKPSVQRRFLHERDSL